MTQEEKAAIISYRKAGVGYSVIAQRLGFSKARSPLSARKMDWAANW